MRRQPPGPRPGGLAPDRDARIRPRTEVLEAALDDLGELPIGLDDAVLSVRNGRRLMLGHGDGITEIAHVDPVRQRTLTVGDRDPTTDATLHWLLAEAFRDDHAFLQVRMTPDDIDRVADRAREQGFSVADEIERGRDDLQTRLNVLRAMKDHDLVATPGIGLLLRGSRTDETVERARELLEVDDEGQDPRR